MGGALLAISVLEIFRKKFEIKRILASVLFLWIGAFLTGAPFEIMGFLFGGTQPPQGFHFI